MNELAEKYPLFEGGGKSNTRIVRPLRKRRIHVPDHAIELSNPAYFLSSEPSLLHQSCNTTFGIEVHVAFPEGKSRFANRGSPGPEPGEGEDRAVFRYLTHFPENGKRIADVVKQTDTDADIGMGSGSEFQEVGMDELTCARDPGTGGIVSAELEHVFGYINPCNACSVPSCKLNGIQPVTAPHVKKRAPGNRMNMLHRELEPLVHVLPKHPVENIRQRGFFV
jgi:hypothetical protein